MEDERRLVVPTTSRPTPRGTSNKPSTPSRTWTWEDLLDPDKVAHACTCRATVRRTTWTPTSSPCGYRMLAHPRLPDELADRLVDHYGSLGKLSRASVEDLCSVDGSDRALGVDDQGRARSHRRVVDPRPLQLSGTPVQPSGRDRGGRSTGTSVGARGDPAVREPPPTSPAPKGRRGTDRHPRRLGSAPAVHRDVRRPAARTGWSVGTFRAVPRRTCRTRETPTPDRRRGPARAVRRPVCSAMPSDLADLTGCDDVGSSGSAWAGCTPTGSGDRGRFDRIAAFYGMIRVPRRGRARVRASPGRARRPRVDRGHGDRRPVDPYTPPTTSRTCAPQGSRSSLYEGPTTASSTTRPDPATGPTTRPTRGTGSSPSWRDEPGGRSMGLLRSSGSPARGA